MDLLQEFLTQHFWHLGLESSPLEQVVLCTSSIHGLPWWLRRQSICLQCGRPEFDPWVGKIPWRRKWQPTPVLLPRKSHGWRNLVQATVHGVAKSQTWLSDFTYLLTYGLVHWCQWYLFLISLDTETHLQTLPNVPFRANYSWWKWLQHPLTWETPQWNVQFVLDYQIQISAVFRTSNQGYYYFLKIVLHVDHF